MKTFLGLDLKRSFWYALSSWRAYLARRHSGAADRFAHSAGHGPKKHQDGLKRASRGPKMDTKMDTKMAGKGPQESPRMGEPRQ